ncbi:MAG: hypothetical protein M3114_02150, partial [Thermoproteota archaeon]|nr:hypothetical protein [Thermoproteota archaeon]
PQEVVGPQGAMGLAMAEEDSRHTEEVEKDDVDATADAADAPGSTDDASSTATTTNTIPTDTLDMMAYEAPSDDATVDSTVMKEEREVISLTLTW